MNREFARNARSDYGVFAVLAVAQLLAFYAVFVAVRAFSVPGIAATVLVSLLVLVCWIGFFMVNPNIAARTQIVAGAVGMVDMALAELSSKQIIDLDDEGKAAMVSNLLVVLCSEESAQPVLNTSSLYT